MSGVSHSTTGSSNLDNHESALWELITAHFNGRPRSRMASSTSTTTPRRHTFDARVASAKSPKININSIILDYLTLKGYPETAANFSKEADLQPQQEDSSIRMRQQIRNSIHAGQIQEAIDTLNDLDHEILDKNPPLHFSLLRLQLVELIRSDRDNIQPALKFATEQLGPRAPQSPEFLEYLEQTMSLLIFSPENAPPELKRLFDTGLRIEVADEVNAAILQHQSARREAAIYQLVMTRAWAENTARESKKDLPDRIELGLNGEDSEAMDERVHDNGHDAMMTT